MRKSKKTVVRACSSRNMLSGTAVSGVKAQGRARTGAEGTFSGPLHQRRVHAGRRRQIRLAVWNAADQSRFNP